VPTNIIPELSSDDIKSYFDLAYNSERRRSPKIMHKKGDYINKVFNFILSDSYMQPHLHPGSEKIEKMHLVYGSFALITFDDNGKVTGTNILEKDKNEFIAVPAFSWHTYVMLSDEVIVYEEMNGVYEPSSWKEMASWAPKENTPEADKYLELLRTNLSI
jgi:cupin fold WbuC family metalloprotein